MLVTEAGPTMRWLNGLGMRYRLMYERQAYRRPDGSYLFWGGLHVGNMGGGQGLMADHLAIAGRLGVRVRYGSPVTDLLHRDGRVTGIVARLPDGEHREIPAESVVLAAGGFESDPDRRERHLGPGWRHAKVPGRRTTPGTCWPPRWTSGPAPAATGPPATASSGTPSSRTTRATGN